MNATRKMMMNVMVERAAALLKPCLIWSITRMDKVVVAWPVPVSYTHLTLPTNSRV